ncbi:4-hydroxythreonine-4-phosphate dehydrogenase PdxA [Gracilimonas tropica]|uniref:4-hydroxythreonine-4-phosphate dehydrogenase PdxA n=1 Tax=Gracilimonas tropica TaxID=454600 RepID=UPI00037EABDC|nr:4-hydroxythreonine-4-phosphate dehydrogenase PdxA [Gracilimonas tropica]
MTTFSPVIGISVGDFNGIGPEIILKTLSDGDLLTSSTPVIISPKEVLEFYSDQLAQPVELNFTESFEEIVPGSINVFSEFDLETEIIPGNHTKESGRTAMRSIETGIDLCVRQKAHALVTAPISKEAVNLAGYTIPGHTEFLAAKTGTDEVLMMLVSGNLRVSLVTTHIPIREVAQTISPNLIERKADILSKSLIQDFGIEKPKIAVFGLNPHAGDGGVIGKEEIEFIEPTIKELQSTHQNTVIHGPFPADGFFGQQLHKKYDGILAMYHDQGLAPFKLLSFGKGVNFTAGLPIIRTSPDHGTAFDIAGKGVANPSSFKEAYMLAVQLAKQRFSEV